MNAPICEDCWEAIDVRYESVHEIDWGTGFLCGPCRDYRAAEDRLDSVHPADALDYMLTGRWR